jgi:hypothetical protein
MDKSFEDCKLDEVKTVYSDWEENEYRAIVLRGPLCINGYVGVPESHSLYGKDYNDIDINCHGGLTYSNFGDGKFLPIGYYWFGWDYAHSSDKTFSNFDFEIYGHGYAPDEVEKEVREVLDQFKTYSQ